MINKIKKFLGIHVHEWSKWKQENTTWVRTYCGMKLPDSEYNRVKNFRNCMICGEQQKYYN